MKNMKKILGILFALVMISVLGTPITLAAGTSTFEDLNTLTADDLADALVGTGVSIVPATVSFTGAPEAAGTFEFTGDYDVIGISSGIILSSGNIADVEGPNDDSATTTDFGLAGDADLDALSGYTTYDATILEFDFEVDPGAEKIYFSYVFGSDEYNFYVYTPFNDVFAFYVNGVNYAEVGGDPVSINTINNGNINYPGNPPSNPDLYINNDPFHADINGYLVPNEDLLFTEMDGFTKVLVFEADVNPGETNTMKLAIADASDHILDCWVFIEAGSLSIIPPEENVYVDIKPGSWPNPMNTKDKGVLPVAICGTEDFDVCCIDPASIIICLEENGVGVSPIRWSYEDVATPWTGDDGGGHCLMGDGYMDLCLKFSNQEVVTTLGLGCFIGDTIPLFIKGNLKEECDGTPIIGHDWVWIIK